MNLQKDKVSVIGEFSDWKEIPLEQLYQSGVWTGFCRDALPGQMYRYVIYNERYILPFSHDEE